MVRRADRTGGVAAHSGAGICFSTCVSKCKISLLNYCQIHCGTWEILGPSGVFSQISREILGSSVFFPQIIREILEPSGFFPLILWEMLGLSGLFSSGNMSI